MAHLLHKGVTAMRTTIACLIASIAAVGSCMSPSTPATPLPPMVQALNTARNQFATPPRPTYSVTWQQSCFCSADDTRAMRITVTNGVITSAVFADTLQPVGATTRNNLKTIDGVFAMIQHAIDEDFDEVSVAYDSQMGYPRTVQLNPSLGAADAGMSLTLSDIAVAATPGGGTGTGGGDSGW
jgi:hypothetical protein